MSAKDAGREGERVTFRLTTGQEILIGFRETPRQKRDRKRDAIVMAECEQFGGVISDAAAREVIEYRAKLMGRGDRREVVLKAWESHPPECRCDDCIPF